MKTTKRQKSVIQKPSEIDREAIANVVNRLGHSKKLAQEFLCKAGITTDDGRLRKQYK